MTILVSMPLVLLLAGEDWLMAIVYVGVLAQTVVVGAMLWDGLGGKRTLWLVMAILVATWGIEAVGVRFGIPFGRYTYSASLQPQLGGVPLLVPVAWMMMLPPAWAVSILVIKARPEWSVMVKRLAVAGLAAVTFTAWDLFLDPMMTGWGLWEWEQAGGYFGIPWSNFAGWMLSAGVITFLVLPEGLPVKPLLIVYAVTWLFQTIALLVFWHQPGPAACGFVGMGVWLAWIYLRRKQ